MCCAATPGIFPTLSLSHSCSQAIARSLALKLSLSISQAVQSHCCAASGQRRRDHPPRAAQRKGRGGGCRSREAEARWRRSVGRRYKRQGRRRPCQRACWALLDTFLRPRVLLEALSVCCGRAWRVSQWPSSRTANGMLLSALKPTSEWLISSLKVVPSRIAEFKLCNCLLENLKKEGYLNAQKIAF